MFRRMTAICFLLAAFSLPAAASQGRDVVNFGNTIVVPEGETAGDLVCFLCSVDAKGLVQGDIVVFMGSIHLDQSTRGDMVVFGGDVWLGDDATIAHDLVVFGGSVHPQGRSRTGGQTVVLPMFLLLPIPIGIVVVLVGVFMLIRWLIRRRQPYYSVPQR